MPVRADSISLICLFRPRDNAQRRTRWQQEERIIGGRVAHGNKYDFAVVLVDAIGPYCGGSLIAKDVVLTAAHCFGALSDVVVNRHDLRNKWEGEAIPMAKQVQHPGYKRHTTNNDFMLVFLERPTAEDVQLAVLNDSAAYPDPSNLATVVGWGDTDRSDVVDTISDQLLEVDVTVITNAECEASSHGHENYHGKITKDMLCAEADLKDSCQGECVPGGKRAARHRCPAQLIRDIQATPEVPCSFRKAGDCCRSASSR